MPGGAGLLGRSSWRRHLALPAMSPSPACALSASTLGPALHCLFLLQVAAVVIVLALSADHEVQDVRFPFEASEPDFQRAWLVGQRRTAGIPGVEVRRADAVEYR